MLRYLLSLVNKKKKTYEWFYLATAGQFEQFLRGDIKTSCEINEVHGPFNSLQSAKEDALIRYNTPSHIDWEYFKATTKYGEY